MQRNRVLGAWRWVDGPARKGWAVMALKIIG